jgi:hypothetical protein
LITEDSDLRRIIHGILSIVGGYFSSSKIKDNKEMKK